MVIVKLGGAAGIAPAALCADIAELARSGQRLALVHGGSDYATRLGEQLGHPPRFVQSPSGHLSRYTDRRTLEIFLQAVSLINRLLVEQLARLGLPALGLSGLDGGLLRAIRKETVRIVEEGRQRILRDDWTGTIAEVDRTLLAMLLTNGYLPVVAPIARSERGEALNVDADRAAAALAGALEASTLVLLSNVPGLLLDPADPATLIRSIPAAQLPSYEEYAQGRMKKKLLAASTALAAGVSQVIIADARRANPLAAALAGEGTVIA